MNWHGIRVLYAQEMVRALRTAGQSIAAPIINTALSFVVFGGVIGSRMHGFGDVPYAAFIVPGLIMLSVLQQSVSNASIGIYFPRFVGSTYELLSAPMSAFELVIAFVGAAATKSVILGLLILGTAACLVPLHIAHPVEMALFLVLTSVSFSLLGFIIGIWAQSFEQIAIVPLLVIMPLTYLGGAFYAVTLLPEPWRTISLFDPIVYLISGFRWSFFDTGDVPVATSLLATGAFLALGLAGVWLIFRTGWRLKP